MTGFDTPQVGYTLNISGEYHNNPEVSGLIYKLAPMDEFFQEQ